MDDKTLMTEESDRVSKVNQTFLSEIENYLCKTSEMKQIDFAIYYGVR